MMSGGCSTNTNNPSTAGIVYYSISQATATPQYTIDTRGFMFGSNTSAVSQVSGTTTVSYTTTTLKSAQKYNVTGTGITVTDLIILVAKAKSDMAVTMVNALILSENTTSKVPSTQLGTTASKALNSFNSGSNVISFTTPVSVSAGNFFATIQAPVIGGSMHDTLSIMSTKLGCSSTDSLAWVYRDVAPFTTSSAWKSIKSFYGQNINNLDVAIFPVIDITAGLNSVSKNGLTLLVAYPNPSSHEVSINFALATSSKVTIDVCDVTGKTIATSELGNLIAGNHTSKLNIAHLSSGVYMYSVKSDDAKMYSKFTVAK